MLHVYTRIQPQSFLGSAEEDFNFFFTIYGHGSHLVQSVEPFEQIDNTPSTEGSM